MLTQKNVRGLFNYDAATGVLTWRVRAANNVFAGDRAGYRRIVRIEKRSYVIARIIWLWMTGSMPVNEIDHIDHNPFNNRWVNLREATDSEQTAHRRNYRSGRLKWTSQSPRSKGYQAQVRFRGVIHRLGTFPTEQEAHNTAYKLAQQLHGKFVHL